MSLRIIAVTNRYLPIVGGAERQLALLTSTLHDRGHKVTILTRHVLSELPAHEIIDGVSVTRLKPTGLGKVANALIIPRIIIYLINHRNEFDLIHSQSLGPVGIAAIIAGKLLDKPIVLRVATAGDIARQAHYGQVSVYTKFIRRYLIPPQLWRAIINKADKIVALSQELVAEARDQAITAPIQFIPNGVDTQLFSPISEEEIQALREKLDLPVDSAILFTSGRLVARKRFDVLLDAMPQVIQYFPNIVLLIAGTGAQQNDRVEDLLHEQVKKLGIEKNVHFLGLIDNVADYLHASDIFVFPSEKEGMPNAVLEAIAVGKPVIASRIGGVTDIIDDSCAYLVPVGDASALAKNIVTALNNSHESKRKGMIARQRAEKQFSVTAVADIYETLYSDLLQI